MIKELLSGPGHTASAIAAVGAGMATHSAAVAFTTYLAGRAFGAAAAAPSDEEIAKRNRVERQENPDLRNKHQF